MIYFIDKLKAHLVKELTLLNFSNRSLFSFSFITPQVLLTTPTTPIERMKAIVEASEGFVYLVS